MTPNEKIQQHEQKIAELRDLVVFYLQGSYFQSKDIKNAQRITKELAEALEAWHALNEEAAARVLNVEPETFLKSLHDD